MKKIFTTCMALAVISLSAKADWPGLQGSGTETDPYQISSAADFMVLANNISADNTGAGEYFKMTKDIDFDGDASNPVQLPSIGKEGITNISTVTWGFEGTFDGGNNSIYYIYHTNDGNNREGQFNALFSSVGVNGVIKNIIFSTQNYISTYNYAGAIASICKGTIDNCTNSANITATGAFAAGICGYLAGGTGTISNCKNYGDIQAMTFASGIVSGSQSGGVITDCSGYSVISCTNSGTMSTTNGTGSAGIAGSFSGNIKNCQNSGKIDDSAKAGQYTAGIVSSTTYPAEISGNTNTGEVIGTKNIAGICGMIMKGDDASYTLSGNTNKGTITATGDNVAGILANTMRSQDMVTIADCTNEGVVSTTLEDAENIGNLRGSSLIVLGEGNVIGADLPNLPLDPESSDDGGDDSGDNGGDTNAVKEIQKDNVVIKDGKYILNKEVVVVKNGLIYKLNGQLIQ